MQHRLRLALDMYPHTFERLEQYLTEQFAQFESVDGLIEVFHGRAYSVQLICAELKECLSAAEPQAGTYTDFLLQRRSYFGLFMRRACFHFAIMLEHERMELLELCKAWRDATPHALVDKWRTSARAYTYHMWRESERRGEYVMTKEYLHAFFDYTLPGCDRELHQHALLNLAHFHMQSHGFRAARAVLDEAILLARTVGDTECMRACDQCVHTSLTAVFLISSRISIQSQFRRAYLLRKSRKIPLRVVHIHHSSFGKLTWTGNTVNPCLALCSGCTTRHGRPARPSQRQSQPGNRA